jgi:hypothetical protein
LLQIALGNVGNDAILAALLRDADRIDAAFADAGVGVVTVG